MAPSTDPTGRRAELLDAAVQVFLRYGFRKTSMDEVARAAGLSRPGLYLHFSSKEVLFQEAVEHLLGASLAQARAALFAPGRSLEERVVAGFAAVHGHDVGKDLAAQHLAELIETAAGLPGDPLARHERAFRDVLIAALEDGVRSGARIVDGVTIPELAALLDAVSVGLKHQTRSLPEYLERMRASVPVLVRS